MRIGKKIEISKIFQTRNSVPVENLDPVTCENCKHEFKGHYCPNCGQEVAEFNRPVGFVLYDFVGNFFAFDTRFLQTFKYLIINPGFLTNEFFQGRRVRYSPPFRNFVFLSFILFILLQNLTERSLDNVERVKSSSTTKTTELNSGKLLQTDFKVKIDSTNITDTDSISKFAVLAVDTLNANNKGLNLNLTNFGSGNIRENLNKIADQIQIKLNHTTNPEDRKKYNSYIAMCRAPEMAISQIMKYLSWMFFILLPVFALILKLFYIRRNQLFIKHFIFSVHLHTYLFFILILVVCLNLLFDKEISGVNTVLLLTFPVYFILAIHKFYGQNWGKVIMKFIGINLIYNVILWPTVLYVFVKSLGIA